MGQAVAEFASEALEAGIHIMERVTVFGQNAACFGTAKSTGQKLLFLLLHAQPAAAGDYSLKA